MEFLWPDSFMSQAVGYDKWEHAAGAGLIVAALWIILQTCRALCGQSYWRLPRRDARIIRRRDVTIIWLIVMAGGVLLEVWQGIFAPLDVAANVMGATTVAWAILAGR